LGGFTPTAPRARASFPGRLRARFDDHALNSGNRRSGIARNGLAGFRRAYPIKQVFGGGMALRVGYVQGARELRR
jgi:hypothetical protein